jgi:hypothetical protein
VRQRLHRELRRGGRREADLEKRVSLGDAHTSVGTRTRGCESRPHPRSGLYR